MTEVDTLGPRLRFLQEASYLLAVQSPSVTAALGAAREKVFETKDSEVNVPHKEWRNIRREVCGACGNLMIPGWSCKISQEIRSKPAATQAKRRRKKDAMENRNAKDLVLTCMRCDRKTVQPLEFRAPKHMKKKKLTHGLKAAAATTSQLNEEKQGDKKESTPKSANANSKQRAKARKGGLQAMLAQSKAQNSSQGLGLDLMDFMQ